MRKKTNWYVITGGPSSGKTTTINRLRERGYKTVIEHARQYLEIQQFNGHPVQEVRSNQTEFQLAVLTMQIEAESHLNPDDVIFLDRAIPDANAYYHYMNIPAAPQLAEALQTVCYKKVFILDCLPMVNDTVRSEDEAAQKKIHAAIVDVYQALPYPIVRVPVLKPEERVDFILKNL
ncbi:MAG: ATP-binding protein [Bacteroidota bacterium]